VKALPSGELQFPAKEFYLAIEACQRLRESAYPSMSVVNLSLGGEAAPEGAVLNGFKRAVASAREAGMSIVAAAGDTGGSVLFPASYSPVLAVGAADAGQAPGTLCSFASRGEGLDLLAPGCDTLTGGLEVAFQDTGEPAFGSGASQTSAEVSAVEASIDSYNPELTPQQTEACLTSSARNGALDAAAAFDACGLERIVQAGEQAERAAQQAPESSPPPSHSEPPAQPCTGAIVCPPGVPATPSVSPKLGVFEPSCSPPRLRATRVGRGVRLRSSSVPKHCRLQARIRSIVHEKMRWTRPYTSRGAVLTVPASAGDEIEARFKGVAEAKLSSTWVRVAVSHT